MEKLQLEKGGNNSQNFGKNSKEANQKEKRNLSSNNYKKRLVKPIIKRQNNSEAHYMTVNSSRKELLRKIEHDRAIDKELHNFRLEIEHKFLSSETNGWYVFPRTYEIKTNDLEKNYKENCIAFLSL